SPEVCLDIFWCRSKNDGMERSLFGPLVEDLADKMVFLSGPRQVGKTTLARKVLERQPAETRVYLNWDRAEHRKVMRTLAWPRHGAVVVLDEVHKYARWKTLVKGFHDTEGHLQRLLVTGSGRLDVFRKGGDSLAGRYHGLRLHPLSVGEVVRSGGPPDPKLLEQPASWSARAAAPAEVLPALLELGGFPEPFLSGSSRTAGRWRLAHREQVLRQDLRDLSLVRELSLVEQLVDLLAERVGGVLSINALREDLQVDHGTVSGWIAALERLQVVFRVPPYARALARALRKGTKLYFWDWSEAPAGGARFENLVAVHLLKLCHWLQDVEGRRVELHYVRDREQHEVDFLLVRDRKPWVLVEAKASGTSPDRSLGYFRSRLKVPFAFQVVERGEPQRDIVPAARLLSALP
ncbi:MAG: ATP-binding protein, partial [Deltaproteobacteria bacterium]|nr:ATP-binding protein [Deltaproteobacteria bacterium]